MQRFQGILKNRHQYAADWKKRTGGKVIGYYEPLIKPQEVGKHYFWTNFILSKIKCGSRKHNATIQQLQEFKGFDLSNLELDHRKDVILRNCVHPKTGLHVFNCAFRETQERLI